MKIYLKYNTLKNKIFDYNIITLFGFLPVVIFSIYEQNDISWFTIIWGCTTFTIILMLVYIYQKFRDDIKKELYKLTIFDIAFLSVIICSIGIVLYLHIVNILFLLFLDNEHFSKLFYIIVSILSFSIQYLEKSNTNLTFTFMKKFIICIVIVINGANEISRIAFLNGLIIKYLRTIGNCIFYILNYNEKLDIENKNLYLNNNAPNCETVSFNSKYLAIIHKIVNLVIYLAFLINFIFGNFDLNYPIWFAFIFGINIFIRIYLNKNSKIIDIRENLIHRENEKFIRVKYMYLYDYRMRDIDEVIDIEAPPAYTPPEADVEMSNNN